MLHPFDYFSPKSLGEAFHKLKHAEDSVILAGGTDLVVNLRSGKLKTKAVIDLKQLPGLREITKTAEGVEIGALVTMNELARSPLLAGPYALLAHAASIMGCFEIRNRATIGGNIINASPGAETLCPLTVLEARVILKNEQEGRIVPLADFLKGPNQTDIHRGEILTKIVLPQLSPDTKGVYMRRQRTRGMDLASVNCALLALHPGNPAAREIRMAFGTVAPVPLRLPELEASLRGKKLDDNTVKLLADQIKARIQPRATSLRATPEYKKIMIETFLLRGMKELLGG